MGQLSFPYERGFSAEYRSLVSPRLAMRDVFRLETVARTGRDAADLRKFGDGDALCQIKVYGACERGLDELMPLLQNLGLRVRDQIQFKITLEGAHFFIRVFSIEPMVDGADLLPAKKPLLSALDALLSGQAENDALNGLIVLTGLHWRDIDLLRAYRNYYLQLAAVLDPTGFTRRCSVIPPSPGYSIAISRSDSNRTDVRATPRNVKSKL